ncbi:MAG: hypothetical protein R3B07_29820 [Polyangiaceae bacterium]
MTVSTSPSGTEARASHASAPARASALGPWLWSVQVDLGVFAGSAAFALLCVFGMRALGIAPGSLPPWAWLVFVLGIDVSHVYSTLFRTYLDGEELARHRVRYLVVPLIAYGIGVALYAVGALWFWRVLAYVAVFHFIRQQVGWVALYRARAAAQWRGRAQGEGEAAQREVQRRQRVDKLIDEVTVYAATLFPIVHWHANLAHTRFTWFVQGDFVDVSGVATAVLPVARAIWVAALIVFALRQLWLVKQEGAIQLGKCVVVATTALTWYVGIVATNSDAEFTVTNVVVHGVPYMALLYFYGQARRREAPHQPGSQLLVGGLLAFAGSLLLLAFVEELIWDRLVWKDNPWLFGGSDIQLGPWALCFLVPLLSLPQFTHYLLDGVLWRRQDTRENAAQRAAIGM